MAIDSLLTDSLLSFLLFLLFESILLIFYKCFWSTYTLDIVPELGKFISAIESYPKDISKGLFTSLLDLGKLVC